jgi:hypothetical protein
MSNVSLPAVGSSGVGIGKFIIISAGAGLGIMLVAQFGGFLPAWVFEQEWIGGFGAYELLLGIGAMLGGAFGALVASKF